jgi:hypothetical protein
MLARVIGGPNLFRMVMQRARGTAADC